MANVIYAADLFCGAGGTTAGLHLAAEAMGLNLRLVAVNHWERAIETHAANHPWAEHFCTGIGDLKPTAAVTGGKLDLLVASPECTHHSIARGGKPCDDQSRASAWHVLHWCQELYVRNIVMENVPEFTSWGPLGPNGRPLKSMRGKTFSAFVAALRSLNYTVDWRILNCADYGDATTRRRFFLVARKGRRPIRWPDYTHGQDPAVDHFGHAVRPWRSAREVIDWSLPGHSIFLTAEDVRRSGLKIRRPLAQNTMRRIEAGIRRFWGQWAEPFLVLFRGTDGRQLDMTARSVDTPVPTLTAGGGHCAVCRPFFVRYNGSHPGKTDGDRRTEPTDTPISTIDTSNRIGVLSPLMMHLTHGGRVNDCNRPMPTVTGANRGELGMISPLIIGQDARGAVRDIGAGLPTITATGAHALVEPFIVKYYGRGGGYAPVDAPLAAVTTVDRFGLVRPKTIEMGGKKYLLDILFRMLTPKELAAAQSFPNEYRFAGNKSEVVKQIGNSVPVRTARALCEGRLAA